MELIKAKILLLLLLISSINGNIVLKPNNTNENAV